MADLNTNLEKLVWVASNPKKQLDGYLQNGKKVVGCFPYYTPQLLADAAGMVPMGLWGAQTEVSLAKSYLPSFACPVMFSNLELSLKGKYKGLSAALIPVMCDTMRNTSQDFKKGNPDIKTIIFTHPQNRKVAAALDFLVTEYVEVKEKLEELSGKKIDDDAIAKSIDTYNTHSRAVREFSQLANNHLDIITPVVRHAVMKSAQFMTKAEHTAILKDINSQLSERPKYDFKGKRIILTGITAEPDQLLEIFIEHNMAVVGDDLSQEMRQYRTDIPAEGTPMERLAKQWLFTDDPMAHDERVQRGELLLNLVKENKADGVILCLMKFCDPEEYEYPTYQKMLSEAKVPVLSIDIDQQPAGYDQARTRIHTFAEIL